MNRPTDIARGFCNEILKTRRQNENINLWVLRPFGTLLPRSAAAESDRSLGARDARPMSSNEKSYNRVAIVPQLQVPKERLAGKFEKSFAWDTLAKRVPVIITKAVNDLYATYSTSGDDGKSLAAKSIVQQLGQLRHQLTRDMLLTPLSDDGSDTQIWNGLLKEWFKDEATWFKAPWLFSECYLYRRIQSIVRNSNWNDYDPFSAQKQSSLSSSWKSMMELSKRVESLSTFAHHAKGPDEEGMKEAFSELIEYALWGNQVDLSLLAGMSHVEIQDLHSTSANQLKKLQEKVILNDTDEIWDLFSKFEGVRIDIVLDNAGFELFNDFCLAHFLIKGGFASRIHFHVKSIPWFVSDVTTKDFTWTLDQLLHQQGFEQSEILKELASEWANNLEQGIWKICQHDYWTTPYSYWYFPSAAPELFEDLLGENSTSALTFFKGDLNYRKLVYDLDWPPTTRFADGLGPLAQAIHKPLVALRTCKANTCVGLSEEQLERVEKEDAQWMVDGKWGLIALQKPLE